MVLTIIIITTMTVTFLEHVATQYNKKYAFSNFIL